MAVFIKTLKMTKCVDIYTNYEQTVVKFYTEGKQKTTKIINFVQGTYQELDGREAPSARDAMIDPNRPDPDDNFENITVPDHQFPTGALDPDDALNRRHSSFEDAYTSLCKFKEMAEKIRSGEISVSDDQVHGQFFGYAQDTIQYTLQGLCEEIALYLVLTNSSPWETSTRDSDDSQIWYNKLPGGLRDVGEFIDNVVSLPFAVANLPMNWIKQKSWEWSPSGIYPGGTNGDQFQFLGKWQQKVEQLIDSGALDPTPIDPLPPVIIDPANPDLPAPVLPRTKN